MTQRVQFEGTVHEFPDDFSSAEISTALSSVAPAQSTALPRGSAAPIAAEPAPPRNATGAPEYYPIGPNLAPPQDELSVHGVRDMTPGSLRDVQMGGPSMPLPTRGLQIGAQGVGRGLADIAGAPVDIAHLIVNTILHAADVGAHQAGIYRGTIGRLPPPVGGSDNISDVAGNVARSAGVEPIAEGDMSPTERMAFNMDRTGTAGLAAGTGLARAAVVRAANPVRTPGIAESLTRPYMENAPRAVATDTAAGVGSGAALSAERDLLPPDYQGPVSDIAAMLLGGLGGATAATAGRAPTAGVRAALRARPDKNIPLDPDTGFPTSVRSADMAARWVQNQTSGDPSSIAKTIGDNVNESILRGEPVPSVGLISGENGQGDIGLTALEKGARLRDPVKFQERDQELRNAAQDKVTGLRDESANPEAAKTLVQNDIADQRKAVQEPIAQARTDLSTEQAANADKVAQAEAAREADLVARAKAEAAQKQSLADAQEAEKKIGGEVAGRAGGQGPASERLDKAVVKDTMEPMAAQQRAKYQAIDPEGKVELDAQPLVDVVKQIRASVPRTVPASEVLPEAWLSKLEGLGAKEVPTGVLDAAGKPITKTEGGDVTFKELNDMRPFLADSIKGAESRGDYSYARNLRALKSHIDDEAANLSAEGNPAGERAADAAKYTKEEFAPRFKQGAGGELRSDIQADDKARTATPPTATAERFLKAGSGGKEVAADLNRILSGSKSEAEGKAAARDYVLADMSKVVGQDGKINPARLRAWIANREGMFSQMPDIKDEATKTLTDVINGRQASTQLQKDLESMVADRRAAAISSQKQINEIKANAKLSESQKQDQISALERTAADKEREIQDNAASLFLDHGPQQAAEKVFASNDPKKAMAQITAKVAKDPDAAAGWKRAVTEHVIDRVTNTNTALVGGQDGPVSIAKLQKFFNQNRDVLSQVYSPEEMNALQRAHKILEPLGNLSRQATVGSPTSENNAALMRVLEAGFKLHFGQLKGGGLMRSMKLALSSLPDSTADAQRLVDRMWLDPELAQHLLTRPVKEVATPAWNAKLNRLLAYDRGAQSEGDPDAEMRDAFAAAQKAHAEHRGIKLPGE